MILYSTWTYALVCTNMRKSKFQEHFCIKNFLKRTTYILRKNLIWRIVFDIYRIFAHFSMNTLYYSIIFLEPLLSCIQTCVNQISKDAFVLKTFQYKPFMFLQKFDLTSSFWFILHFLHIFMMDTLYDLTWINIVSLITKQLKV